MIDESKIVRVPWEYPEVKWWDLAGKAQVKRCKERIRALEKRYGVTS